MLFSRGVKPLLVAIRMIVSLILLFYVSHSNVPLSLIFFFSRREAGFGGKKNYRFSYLLFTLCAQRSLFVERY